MRGPGSAESVRSLAGNRWRGLLPPRYFLSRRSRGEGEAPAPEPEPERLRRHSRLFRLALGGLVWAAWAACEGDQRRPAASVGDAARARARAAGYAIGDDALYDVKNAEVLAVLPGSSLQASDTIDACAAAGPELGPARFFALRASPDGIWAAWETTGPVVCIGVVGPQRPAVRVLGRWATALPDSLLWSPIGHYLGVWLSHRDGRRSLMVYDAEAGKRVSMPWDEECEGTDDCDVARADWLGGTLLNVEIRRGSAELTVPIEVNVSATVTVERVEEI